MIPGVSVHIWHRRAAYLIRIQILDCIQILPSRCWQTSPDIFSILIKTVPPGLQSPVRIRIIGLPILHHNRSLHICNQLSIIGIKHIPGIANPADALQHHPIGIKIIPRSILHIGNGLPPGHSLSINIIIINICSRRIRSSRIAFYTRVKTCIYGSICIWIVAVLSNCKISRIESASTAVEPIILPVNTLAVFEQCFIIQETVPGTLYRTARIVNRIPVISIRCPSGYHCLYILFSFWQAPFHAYQASVSIPGRIKIPIIFLTLQFLPACD